jgi:hypothetical protein
LDVGRMLGEQGGGPGGEVEWKDVPSKLSVWWEQGKVELLPGRPLYDATAKSVLQRR